jgi:hypothetical protein
MRVELKDEAPPAAPGEDPTERLRISRSTLSLVFRDAGGAFNALGLAAERRFFIVPYVEIYMLRN